MDLTTNNYYNFAQTKSRKRNDGVFGIMLRGVLIILLISFMVILAGANTSNQDIQSSIWEFNGDYGVKEGEWLNWIIISLCKSHNISFEWYHLLLYVFGYILIFYTIFKRLNISLVGLVAYFIFPFTIDFIQTPNFVSMSLFVFSLNFLAKRELFANRILFLVFVLLGAGMQVISYAFVPLVFLPAKINEKKLFKIGFFLLIASLSITMIDKFTNIIGLLLNRLPIFSDLRAEKYINSSTSFGFVVYWAVQILSFVLLWTAIKKSRFREANRKRSFYILVYSIVCYVLLFMPIISRSGTLFRLERNCLILVIFVWCSYSKSIKNRFNRFFALSIPVLISSLLFAAMNGETILYDLSNVFKDNWILNNVFSK